jgi:Bacterial Ig-like domain (group 3)/FG-GAP-like repeat/Abnormal spindle-like microcephaly-assoc'd, ASPM-SPD-2-Hydin/Protein of unknown function (DUF1573)
LRNRILLITWLLTLATLASAQNFVAPRIYSLGAFDNIKQMAIGDFNGDGKPDVVVPYETNPGQIAVLLNNGNGTFKAPLVSNGAGADPIAIAVGDFNGDGKLDVVVAGYGTKQQGPIITVLLGKGDGTFQTGQNFPLASTPEAMVVGDFNNDGKLDVMVSVNAAANINILLGNGDGSLQSPIASTVGSGTNYVVGDFNGDGNLDLFVPNPTVGNITVAFGNGDGTFQAGKNTFLNIDIVGLTVGDVNHDGKLDVVTGGGSSVNVLLGNGDGTFQAAKNFPAGESLESIALADINHDGNLDIVLANEDGYNVVSPALIVLLGNGDGTFGTAAGYSVSFGLQQVLVADFNGDGYPDVAGLNIPLYYSTLSVALGIGDGTFIAAPTYGIGFSPGIGLTADFNNDGIPDLALTVTLGGGAAVMLGKGDGTFEPTGSSGRPPEEAVSSIAIADFNRDGNLDIASANQTNVVVELGTGTGTFSSATNYVADSGPFAVATGDVNGDGILDLVAVNYKSNDISVLLGNGDGTFGSATNYNVGQVSPFALVLADFNGDQKLDLAIASSGNGTDRGGFTVMLGNGDGTFGAPKEYGKDNFVSVTAADINGDGKLDLISSGYDPSTNATFISVFLGNGDGTFQKALNTATTSYFYTPIVADYNGDGKLDLAVGSYVGTVDIYLGKGNGTFQAPVYFGAANYPAYLIGGDFNSDGAPDIAAENIANDTVSILLNTAGTFLTTTSSVNPSAVGQSVTFTATIKGSINTTTTPTGSVTFYDGTTSLGKVTMAAGSASLSISTLTTGSHTITASYSGDTNFFAHTGAPLTQSVQSGPLVTLSPTSLTFASQNVGTVSPPQTIILTNSGVSTLTINTIVASGDYAVTSTCTTSLAAGKKCSITVTFAPSASGTRTGTVSVTDNAPDSPQTVSLTGTGIAPVVTLSPTTLTFATQLVSTTSSPQTVTLTNTGTAALTISLISITGADPTDYLESNTCGSTVAVNATCTISVAFHPKARGTRTASLSVSDNAVGGPQTVALSGTATVVTLSAASIDFGTEAVGKTSAPNTLTLTNTAQVSLTISSIAITGANPGDFAQTNTCGTGIRGGATCTISVTFTPTKKGARSASVSITDSGGGSPQTVSVTGTGN